ncbi:hypothetical protein [Rhizobium sp. BK176]|uniref:hypothetical protein n=1 Tax=Rhizobium sp. BK176 TaxID=2587071 RepID=UPI0021692328|nr:hypothetical protein [Rhizobium sp. BK176]MCS4089233.1 hypothetical protein [Rhizobium sp. BK176]
MMVPSDKSAYDRPVNRAINMLFSVPIHFNLTATRIGGERRQSTQAWSIVDFEMTDLSDSDVPVATRWRQDFKGIEFTRGGVATAIGASPAHEFMHVRKFGEHFFRPVVIDSTNSIAATKHGEDAAFLTGQRAADLLASFAETSIFATPMPGGTHQKRLRANGGDGLADFASVDNHDLDRRVRNVRERLSKFLLVEGVLYERCQEPKVAVFTTEVEFNDSREPQLGTFAFVTSNPYALTSLDKNAVFFEIEDYGSAAAKAQRANKSRLNRNSLEAVNSMLAPEIDQADSIYARDVAWIRRVTRIAVDMAARIGEQRASALSEELYAAYRDLHKCLHMSDGEDRFSLMGEAMAAVLAECRGQEWQHLADAASAGLEILDNRPVDVEVKSSLRPSLG